MEHSNDHDPGVTKLAALACGAALLLVPFVAPAEPATQPGLRVLAFTKTAGFRHDSIPAALRALRELGTANGIAVDATEDGSVFSDAGLARYDAVIFLLTTGDVLDDAQQGAFERYVRGGGGYAGVHSAADTEYGWPWYGELVGAYFRSHPDRPARRDRSARARCVDRAAAAALGADGRVVQLCLLPEQPRPGPRTARRELVRPRWRRDGRRPPDRLGARRWAKGARGTRAAGIRSESYAEPLFRAHLLGGILYAAGYAGPRFASVARRRSAAGVWPWTCVRPVASAPARAACACGSADAGARRPCVRPPAGFGRRRARFPSAACESRSCSRTAQPE